MTTLRGAPAPEQDYAYAGAGSEPPANMLHLRKHVTEHEYRLQQQHAAASAAQPTAQQLVGGTAGGPGRGSNRTSARLLGQTSASDSNPQLRKNKLLNNNQPGKQAAEGAPSLPL